MWLEYFISDLKLPETLVTNFSIREFHKEIKAVCLLHIDKSVTLKVHQCRFENMPIFLSLYETNMLQILN